MEGDLRSSYPLRISFYALVGIITKRHPPDRKLPRSPKDTGVNGAGQSHNRLLRLQTSSSDQLLRLHIVPVTLCTASCG